MAEKTATYIARSKTYLTQAHEELNKGDFLQASEKGWGAASQMVKAVAEEHGLAHGRHNHLLHAVRWMSEQTQDREYEAQFGRARDLHANFYEEWLSPDTIKSHLSEIGLFVQKAEGLLNGAQAAG